MTTLLVILLIVNLALIVLVVTLISKGVRNESGETGRFKGDVELVHDNVLLQDDLKDFSSQVLLKIDERMGQLKKLLKEADDRISTLEAMVGNNRSHTQAAEVVKQKEREDAEDKLSPEELLAAAREKGMSRNAVIMRLHRRGLSPAEIAQEVGIGRGEVELIINIEDSRRKA